MNRNEPNRVEFSGKTIKMHKNNKVLLCVAIGLGYEHIVKYFINNMHEISYEKDLLHIAAKSGKLSLFKYLTEKFKEFGVEYYDDKMLYNAINKKSFKLAKFLMEEDKNSSESSKTNNLKSIKSQRELHTCVRDSQLELAKYLIEDKGFYVNGMYRNQTPLTIATREGSIQMFNFLIKKLNDFEIDENVFKVALKMKRLDFVRYFIKKKIFGVNMFIDNVNPIDIACENRDFEMIEFLVCEDDINLSKVHFSNIAQILKRYNRMERYIILSRILSKGFIRQEKIRKFFLRLQEDSDSYVNRMKNEMCVENSDCLENTIKAKEKWLLIPNDIWFYTLNEFFDDKYHKTNHLIKLMKTSKSLYKQLINSDIVMNNFTFTLKSEKSIENIVKLYKPRYKIRNLCLTHIRHNISNEQLSFLLNDEYFKLHKLNISFCNRLSNICFNYFKNVVVLTMTGCDQDKITNNGIKKLKNLKKLNIAGCNQSTINDELFDCELGKQLKELNITSCSQFTDKIFNYLSNNCKIQMVNLNIKRSNKRKINEI
jgi:hypothetical protein